MVMASKGQDCAKGSMVQVQVSDLQDMQNHMRETLDQGLADLQKKQGQGGIPAAPASVLAPAKPTEFAQAAPPPDPNVKAELSQEAKEADQAEQEVLKEAAGGPSADGGSSAPPPPAAPPKAKKLDVGMTIDEVKGMMGDPKDLIDVGAKKIYVYDAVKITFVNGKLTEVK
jgi:TolA-binding protein